MPSFVSFLAFIMLACLSTNTHADILVKDDAGNRVRLKQPARRIVSLAPNITETLFAAGGGDRVVGTVSYGDYPAAAKSIARVGSYARIDLEALLALKPDLVIGWQSGNPAAAIAKLRSLGLPVFLSEPRRIEDIAHDLERYGRLMGNAAGGRAAESFRTRLATLRARYSQRPKLRVFYQVWAEPLMTVGRKQIIGDVIRLCGGENVFDRLEQLAPSVSIEAVLAENPDVIIASGMDQARPEWLDNWRRWPQLAAVAGDNLYVIPPDIIQRHTPRLLDGAERLCRQLEEARGKKH